MRELKDYYEKRKGYALLFCIACWVILAFVFYHINDGILCFFDKLSTDTKIAIINENNKSFYSYILNLLIGFVTPTSIATFIYFSLLNYIDKKGWKKHFPQYNLSGKWKDTTIYTKGLDNTGWIASNIKSVPSYVEIDQTCHTIKILPSMGDFFTWRSLSADWENANLTILYKVEYFDLLQEQGYPENRIGYESMQIDTSNLSDRQRPYKMVGKFWHCVADDGKPIYMGDVTYERET